MTKSELETTQQYYLYRLLRRMQQKNRFVTLDLDFSLTILQSFIVLQVAAGLNSAQALAELFQVDQSTMSRNLSSLTSLGYLQMSAVKSDARKRQIVLSSKGQKFLKQYDTQSDLEILSYSKLMSQSQREDFAGLFAKLNDNLQAPKLNSHSGDSPWRLEMRRITFALGAFRETFLDCAISIAEWQVLSELIYQDKCLSQAEIAQRTGIAQTSLPALIARLVKRKMLKMKSRKQDARVKDVLIQKAGIDAVHEVERGFAGRLERSLIAFHPDEKESFIKLFELYIGETASGQTLIAGDLLIKKTTSLDDFKHLRQRLIAKLHRENSLSRVPERLFDSNSEIWIICNRLNEIIGGLEILRDSEALRLVNFFVEGVPSEKNILDKCKQIITADLNLILNYEGTYLDDIVRT